MQINAFSLIEKIESFSHLCLFIKYGCPAFGCPLKRSDLFMILRLILQPSADDSKIFLSNGTFFKWMLANCLQAQNDVGSSLVKTRFGEFSEVAEIAGNTKFSTAKETAGTAEIAEAVINIDFINVEVTQMVAIAGTAEIAGIA